MARLKKIIHFPYWWYWESLIWFKRLFNNCLVFLDNKLAVSLMAKMIIVPLFQDTSLLGRILSFIFRSVRVIIGGLIILVAFITMIFWLIVWLCLPMVIISLWPQSLAIWILIWLADTVHQLKNKEIDRETQKLILKANQNQEKLKYGLCQNSKIIKILNRLEIAPQAMLNLNPPAKIELWLEMAKNLNPKKIVNLEWLLLAWLKQENWRFEEALETINWLEQIKKWTKTPFIWEKNYQIRPIGGVDRAWTSIPTPFLDQYSLDLTKLAQKKQLPEMFGKKETVQQIIQILSKEERNNVLIIGEPGSGKSTLVKSLAQEIVRGIIQTKLRFKRLISLDTTKLAAGADSAELNRRITKIIEEIRASKNIILFVDEIHNLASINQDKPETSDLFAALEPVLSEGEFQFIGATNTKNYKNFIEPNSVFSNLMETVELKEAGPKTTLKILQYLAWEREIKDQVYFSSLALKTIINLTQKLIHDRVWPDKAIRILDEAAAIAKNQNQLWINSNQIESLMAKKTKIPITQLNQKEIETLLNLEKKLEQRIIGQTEAIKALANAIRRSKTGLKSETKPIASFLFAGPTGVGKTETAKALAEQFFGSEKLMIRIDMSEYQNLDSLDRLVEQLTDSVQHQPYTLILLDEIEKAHEKIINVFLQVLDDARLTDKNGRTIDFNHTIIIATTNVGTGSKNIMEAIENYFAPEWLNRFSGIIIFKTLTLKMAESIVRLKLNQLSNNLKKQEIWIKFKDETVKMIAQEGWSEKWGGRQLERIIQEKIGNQIAEKLLRGEIKKRTLWIN